MEVFYLLIGLLIGAFSIFFIFNAKLKIANNQLLVLQSQNEELKKVKEAFEANTNQYRTEIHEWERKYFALESDLKVAQNEISNRNQLFKEQKENNEKIQEQFKAEFKNLATEILEEKSKSFSKKSQDSIEQLLNPLKTKIEEFKVQIQDTYNNETRERFSLGKEIKQLANLNTQLTEDARSLTKALKGDSKVQGDWGEMILENILEQSGLSKGREYLVQESFDNEEGGKSRPDVVIRYPGNRCVIIDSKVSLTNYEQYTNASTDSEKEIALKKHILSVNKHIKELSDKSYQDVVTDCKSTDFVMMFLPIEPAYLLAIQNSPQLWQNAYKKKILLISPTNLIAALRMIKELWYQDKQNRNVAEIAKESGSLIDKIMGFLEDFDKLEKAINSLDKSYSEARKKLHTGKGNLLSKAMKIKKLGAKSSKEIPSSFVSNITEMEDTPEINLE